MQNEQELIAMVFSLLQQIKLFHWATMSYAKHKALDDLHSSLSDKTDILVESYIGKLRKQPLPDFKIVATSISNEKKIVEYLESERDKWLQISTDKKIVTKHPELQNIIQEMVSEMDKALYLCHLQ